MARILIKGARWVVTMNPAREIITDGAVAVDGDRIALVGKTAAVEQAFAADVVIDAADRMVLPGLIQAHVHNTQFLCKGLTEGAFLKQSLFDRIFPYEVQLSAEDAYWSSYACQMNLLRTGVTSFVEAGSYYPDAVGQVTVETGLRGIITRSAADVHGTGLGTFPADYIGRETLDETLDRGAATVERWHGREGGRIRAWMCMRFLQAASDDLIRETVRLAEHYGVGYQTHLAHSREGIEATLAQCGRRDVERMQALDALRPQFLGIHMGWVTMRELLAWRDAGCKVAHCPSSNLSAAYGTFLLGKIPEMLALGITVALGSDACFSGHFVDILREMHLAISMQKDVRMDSQIIPHEKALEMATVDGARALGWDDEIGALIPGYKADIALFDVTAAEWYPAHNPIQNFVYCSEGTAADTVLVDGRILMQNKQIRSFDAARTAAAIQAASDGLAARCGVQDHLAPRWPVC